MERVQRILKIYKVDRAQDKPLPPRRSPFTFHPDGFYCSLRKKVWDQFGGEIRSKGKSRVAALGPSNDSKNVADAMLVLSYLAALKTGKIANFPAAALGALGLGLLNGSFIGIGHNMMHQEDNFRQYYMNLSGFNTAEFRMHHALSHHPYTNTVMDAELNGSLPILSFFPSEKEKTKAEKIAGRSFLAFRNFFGIPILMTRRLALTAAGKWPGTARDKLSQLLPLSQLAILAHNQGSWSKGLALWMLMLTSSSAFFLWGNFLTGPHFNTQCWHQGDTLDDRDWGIAQCQTSTERKAISEEDTPMNNKFNTVVFALHHLHHLFPTIDGNELSKLVPLFREHCKEYNVKMTLMSGRELQAGLYECIDGYKPNTRTLNGVYSKL